MKKSIFLLFCFCYFLNASGQKQTADSLIQLITTDQSAADPGLQLIQSGNYSDANKFFSNEISKDESDRAAYFRRGVANWALSDTLSACRDWSAVLALGDTEMFNLLDSKCHGSMIISEDTIPSGQYHKLWSKESVAQGQNAKTVVDEMPSFEGGENKLFEYISSNLKKPAGNLHGTVYINFLISPKGKIVYPYVSHGINKIYDKEALRIVRNMPHWKPGKQNGKPMYVRSNIPIRF